MVRGCLGYDPHLLAAAWPGSVQRVGLEELFGGSDAITLHLPLTEETRGHVGEQQLARMRRSSYLVNTSLGGLVDPDAVVCALDEGRHAGVALDVLPEEPPRWGHPLLTHS